MQRHGDGQIPLARQRSKLRRCEQYAEMIADPGAITVFETVQNAADRLVTIELQQRLRMQHGTWGHCPGTPFEP